jgi:hypothetical protein
MMALKKGHVKHGVFYCPLDERFSPRIVLNSAISQGFWPEQVVAASLVLTADRSH